VAIVNRRHFIGQTVAAAALYGCPRLSSNEARDLFNDRGQSSPPLDADSVRKLASNVTGHVITPNSSEYETARLIFNRAFDRRPAVIVRCSSSPDVARALEFARTWNLPLAVHGGGHSRLGYGMCDGGLVIDLSSFKRVEINAGKQVARAQAGALVRDLDEATQRFGLATTSGGCPTVGIAGFTLGGGEGRLMDKYGAACDNLLSAEVVTVDGRQVEASQKKQSRSLLGDPRGRRKLRRGYGAGVSTSSCRPGCVGSPDLSARTHPGAHASFRRLPRAGSR